MRSRSFAPVIPGRIDDEVEELAQLADNHPADTATATLDREIDYTLEENSSRMLVEIDAALKRIDDGTFGTCANCARDRRRTPGGVSVGPLCIDCKRDAERT